jgi:hypothetical protein
MFTTFIKTFGSIAFKIIDRSLTIQTSESFFTLALVVSNALALIDISAVVLTVVIVLTKCSSIRLITLTLLLRGADAVIVTIMVAFQLNMTIIFEVRLHALTSLLASTLIETVIRTSYIGVQNVQEAVWFYYILRYLCCIF